MIRYCIALFYTVDYMAIYIGLFRSDICFYFLLRVSHSVDNPLFTCSYMYVYFIHTCVCAHICNNFLWSVALMLHHCLVGCHLVRSHVRRIPVFTHKFAMLHLAKARESMLRCVHLYLHSMRGAYYLYAVVLSFHSRFFTTLEWVYRQLSTKSARHNFAFIRINWQVYELICIKDYTFCCFQNKGKVWTLALYMKHYNIQKTASRVFGNFGLHISHSLTNVGVQVLKS